MLCEIYFIWSGDNHFIGFLIDTNEYIICMKLFSQFGIKIKEAKI